MCAVCGLADPSHDALILRGVLLVAGSGALMLPRAWLERAIGLGGRKRPAPPTTRGRPATEPAQGAHEGGQA